jgi:hypothetical protein
VLSAHGGVGETEEGRLHGRPIAAARKPAWSAFFTGRDFCLIVQAARARMAVGIGWWRAVVESSPGVEPSLQ